MEKRGKRLTVSEVLKKQGEKVIVTYPNRQDMVMRVVEYALSDDYGTYSLRNAIEGNSDVVFYECIEVGKVKVCTHVWSYGTFDDIEMAERVARMVLTEVRNKEIFIKDAETDKTIKTITLEELDKERLGRA